MRLLVVEDEKKLCDMIAKSLHQSGYEVDVCNDGEEALDMIYAEMYDLIVLDLNLPGVDGMEILRELRKEDEETKIIKRKGPVGVGEAVASVNGNVVASAQLTFMVGE